MASESTRLKGLLGGQTAAKLAKHRQIETVGDLLALWPRRYLSHEDDFGSLREGDYVVAVATVRTAATRPMQKRRGRMLNAVITDGAQELDVTFFDARGHEKALIPGSRHLFGGTVTRYRDRLQLAHPGYTTLAGWEEREEVERGLIAVYPSVPGVHSWTITECVRLVVHSLDEVADILPEQVREKRGLPHRRAALELIHTPRTQADVAAARRRLRYEEALLLQLILVQRRAEAAAVVTRARQATSEGILADFDAALPFTLTPGQEQVGRAISDDLARPTPMHRLLQGEVGSGKTLVALRAMLAVIEAGGQAALLAPTEVLAAQHARSIRAMLGPLAEGGMLTGAANGTTVTLLTGGLSAAARKRALLDIASGEAGIVIGTHALLQEKVSFADLALVVVDEQHRFGVEQRDALRAKASAEAGPPHVLTMTATPIPRTVAMTVFGDMETSTLRELPAGRAPITSHVVPMSKLAWVERAWERLAAEIEAGHQAYLVCPRIGDGEDPSDETADEFDEGALVEATAGAAPTPLSVEEMEATLSATPALASARIATLHGRMSSEEKEEVMSRFTAGEIDLLISTTVIEVGVDNPNATAMVIMDADRFGVSQLHQLRGRVGRGGLPGLALLMTRTENPATLERLTQVAATTDGFALSRLDLATRKEGDVLGSAQHGARSQLQHLSLLRDEEIIEQARADAEEILSRDPELAGHPELAAAMRSWMSEDQAAYLEKG